MRVPSIFRNCLLAGSFIALCATTSWAVPVKLPLNPVETWVDSVIASFTGRVMDRGAIPVITLGGAFCMTTLLGWIDAQTGEVIFARTLR